MRKGELFLLTSPSGTGKDTIIDRVVEAEAGRDGALWHSISHTTRRPRSNEVDGEHYYFVDRATFEAMAANEEFLESAEYNGNLYGTSVREVMPRLERGIDVILDIDVQGAEQILQKMPEAHGILVLPPSYETLRDRLQSRGQEDATQIAERLAVSVWEIERYELFGYAIINDELDLAVLALTAIILEKRLRRDKQKDRIETILQGFRSAVRGE
jgi:guanylate kinase